MDYRTITFLFPILLTLCTNWTFIEVVIINIQFPNHCRICMIETDNSGYSTWCQVRRWSGTLKRLFNTGCFCHLPICCSLWMVMGTARVDRPKRDLSIRNPISRTKHNSICQPLLHLRHRSGFPFSTLRFQIRDLPLLCRMDNYHDHLCVHLPARNKRHPNRRNGSLMEKTLVLEEDNATNSSNWWERFWKLIYSRCLMQWFSNNILTYYSIHSIFRIGQPHTWTMVHSRLFNSILFCWLYWSMDFSWNVFSLSNQCKGERYLSLFQIVEAV